MYYINTTKRISTGNAYPLLAQLTVQTSKELTKYGISFRYPDATGGYYMWQIVESISFIPADAVTVHCLEFADGCIWLVYVPVEYSGESMHDYSSPCPDTGNQCVDLNTQLELEIDIPMELNYSSRWV